MVAMIRIAIVDDHPLFRDGVAATLKTQEGVEIVARGACAADAIRICVDHEPDILLLDIMMPGDGLVAAAKITRGSPRVRIIMLTASDHEEHVARALEAGARGYVLKDIGVQELVNTVRSIHAGQTYVTPDLAARLLSQMQKKLNGGMKDELATLTPREDEILGLVALGLTNKEIARDLRIAEKTVKHFMTNIMQKLQVRNRVEAVLALRKSRNGEDVEDRDAPLGLR